MSESSTAERCVRFGVFRLDLAARKLYKNELPLKLPRQSFRILELLVKEPGRVVTRKEIIADLWPSRTYGDFDAGINTAIGKLRAVLCDAADSPRFIARVPLSGYRFIAPVEVERVERNSPDEHRKASMSAVPDSHPAKQEEIQQRRWSGLPGKVLMLLAISCVAVISGLTVFLVRRPQVSPKAGSALLRRSVAIMGFRNLSNRADEAWISTLLAEELTAELGAGEEVRTIPGESIVRMKKDLALPDTDTFALDTLARVRVYLGADYVILGSYFNPKKNSTEGIRVDLRLQDAGTGEIVASVIDKASESELPDLVSRMGATLRDKLGIGMFRQHKIFWCELRCRRT